MALSPQEWLRQADYDVDTAQAMFDAGRYFYLMSLLKRIGAVPPESIGKFTVRLNEASVVTRYPESLDAVQRDFTAQTVPQILAATRETLAWTRTLF